MAFAYAAGTVVNIDTFFTILETWLVNTIGWILVSGSGTQDLILSSDGEYGDYAGYTGPIYVHIYQGTAANDKYIYGQVYLDAAGTQKSTETTVCRLVLNDAGDSFDYYMSADKEAFVIYVKDLTSGNYTRLYLGTLIPYAKTLSGPEYMLFAGGGASGYLLKGSAGSWSTSGTEFTYTVPAITAINELDSSVALFAAHINTSEAGVALAGQLRHVSARTYLTALSALTYIKTFDDGIETEWIILPRESTTTTLTALRIGGDISTGVYTEDNFQYTTGIASDKAALFAALEAWLVGTVGWTVESGSGTETIVYSSIGESGTDAIFIRYRWASDYIYGRVQNDAAGTQATSEANISIPTTSISTTIFPTRYHFCGDKDCICITVHTSSGGFNEPLWLGALTPFALTLPETSYKLLAYSERTTTRYSYLLRKNAAATSWNYAVTALPTVLFSAPLQVDPQAYYLVPMHVYQSAAPITAVGIMKYIMRSTSSPTLSVNDTLQIGNQKYTNFYQGSTTFYNWAMRTQ